MSRPDGAWCSVTSAAFSLLLVNRYLYQEAKHAIEKSRTGIVKSNSSYIEAGPRLFDNAITIFETNQRDYVAPVSIKALKTRFSNLRVVRNTWVGRFMHSTYRTIRAKSVLSVLESGGDRVLRNDARFLYYHHQRLEEGEEDFFGIAVSWSVEVDIRAHRMSVPAGSYPHWDGLRLVMEFEIDEGGCRICKKWLKDKSGREIDLTAAMSYLRTATTPVLKYDG